MRVHHHLAGIARPSTLLVMNTTLSPSLLSYVYADQLDPTAVPQVVAAAAAMLPADNTTDLARQVGPAADYSHRLLPEFLEQLICC